MQTENDGNYHARLNILTADTKFRIQAGLAQGQWFDLDTAPALKSKPLTSPTHPPLTPNSGNLPTTNHQRRPPRPRKHCCQPYFKTNQPISKGELRLDLSTTPANRTIPLEVSEEDPTLLHTTENSLRLLAPGTYRVHLGSPRHWFRQQIQPQVRNQRIPGSSPQSRTPPTRTQPPRPVRRTPDPVHAQADDDSPSNAELHLRPNNGR